MKKFFALTVALVVLSAGSAFAAISSSSHDFSGTTWTNDICAPCHTPHNAISGAGPLWAHTTSGASFTMYSNPASMDNSVAATPTSVSLACLSCHDGVTAMDSFIGGPASPGVQMGATSVGNLGTDLTDDHPISITLVDGSDTQIYDIATITGAGLPLYGASTNILECATCHDVHNGTGNPSMLRLSNDSSTLCLTCHNK